MTTLWRRLGARPAVRLAIPWLWMAVIFWFSAQPKLPDLTPGLPGFEAIAGHLFMYAVLALLWRRALQGAGVRHSALLALLFALLYGLSDEYHQSFVPNRTPSFFDVATDACGAGAALVINSLRERLGN